MENLKYIYLSKIEKDRAEEKRLKKLSLLLVLGKIFVFLSFLYSLYISYNEFAIIKISISFTLFSLYLFIYWLDDSYLSKIDHIKRKRVVILNEISYLEGNFSMFNDGKEYIDISHAYSYDLDLFGPDSLFARINRSITKRGEKLLAYRLTHLIDEKDGIVLFRDAIDELKCLTDLCIDLHSQPFINDNLEELSQSISKRIKMTWLFSPYFAYTSVSITLLSLILGVVDLLPMTLFGMMFIFQLIIASILSRRVSQFNISAENLKSEFRGYNYILEKVRAQEFTSEKLKALHFELFSSENGSIKAFSELSRILNMFDQRNSEFFYVILNGLFLYDIYITGRFNRWIRKYLSHMDIWIDCIAQIDMLTSFATYAYNNPNNVQAELIDDEKDDSEEFDYIIESTGIYHPFLSLKTPVVNDFLLKRGNIAIITGANMAGKSTFLRTVGLNYILACCGVPVAASSFRFTLVSLFSSMRTTDNLSKDISYFNAELIRLGLLIDHVRSHKHTLIILDEILKGTNSKDKLEGSLMFLNQISSYNVSGLIATHDLELSKLEQSDSHIFLNYCFEIELSDEIKYSYKINRGVSKNMNATYLLKGILKKLSLFLILLLSTVSSLFASGDTLRNSSIHHQLEFNIARGYLFQTTEFFKGANTMGRAMDKSSSYHLKYGFRFSEDSYFGRLYPHTYQGIGVSLFDFYNNTDLGRPISIYLYQGSPIVMFGRSLSLDYEWNFGASFGWKQYDKYKNPYNTVVGSRVNAYVNLGLYLNWQLSSDIKFKVGADASHFSNGNTKYPNGGVNSLSLRAGAVWCFDTPNSKISGSRTLITPFKPFWSYDLMIYGATRFKGIPDENYLVPGKFAIFGMNFSPMYNFNRYLNAGVSLDIDYDESANLENHIAGESSDHEFTFYRQPFSERFAVGLSARVEFVMPIFSINFGLGNDILYHGDSTRGFYQMLALKSSITHNLYLNIGYQLSKFHTPKNLMIGFGYRFNNKREPKKALQDILR